MHKNQNNYAFIDSQNLYLAIKELGWKLDYQRFRVYLREKYHVDKAYMFLGYVDVNHELYRSLQEVGFILIFRPILQKDGQPIKGNCDVDDLKNKLAYKKEKHPRGTSPKGVFSS